MATQQETSKNTPKPSADGSKDAKPTRKSGKLLWIIVAVLVLAGAGGGVYAFLFQTPNEHKAPVQEPAVFVPLETFTVNLLPTEGVQQYLQVNVTLKISGRANEEAVKSRMPEVRNGILMLLSGKRANELLSSAGKEKLALDVGDAVRKLVEPAKPVEKSEVPAAPEASAAPAAEGNSGAQAPRQFEVLFTGFIIQ
jgi:flagellar FliL protein